MSIQLNKKTQKYVVFKDWSIGRVYHVAVAAMEKETENQITLKYDFKFYSMRRLIRKEDVLLILNNRTKAIEIRDLFTESSRRYRASIDKIQGDLMLEYAQILEVYKNGL